ncbi:hypothetical protein DDD63_07715 [Actinobaculum sp. 313]|nr:hypothetical protein DDD63_07715 [Actinobaculum sp. 313]
MPEDDCAARTASDGQTPSAVDVTLEPFRWRDTYVPVQWLMWGLCPILALVLPGGGDPGVQTFGTLLLLCPYILVLQATIAVLSGKAMRLVQWSPRMKPTAILLGSYYLALIVAGASLSSDTGHGVHPSILESALGLEARALSRITGVVALAVPILLFAALCSAIRDYRWAKRFAPPPAPDPNVTGAYRNGRDSRSAVDTTQSDQPPFGMDHRRGSPWTN